MICRTLTFLDGSKSTLPHPQFCSRNLPTRPNHRPRTKTPTSTSTSTSTPTPTPVIGDGRGRDGLLHVSQSCERNSPGAVRACVPTCASQPQAQRTKHLSSPLLFSPSLLAHPEQPPARSPQKHAPLHSLHAHRLESEDPTPRQGKLFIHPSR